MVKTEQRTIGDIGEDCASKYLIELGFTIIEKNYLRKWGEIDIIAEREGVLYFVEVKTRSVGYYINGAGWRPEDNLHRRKLERIKRAIQTYLLENRRSIEDEWEFSAITVILKRKTHEIYKIEHLENLII
jgi:putative endonuclease